MPAKLHRYFFLVNATRPRKTSNTSQSTTKISIHNKVKFLGVTFDSSLSFKTHINLTASKAKHRVMRLHTIYNQSYGHHASPIQNVRSPSLRIRPHHYHHRVIQKHEHMGRHTIQIHKKQPPSSPHIPRKCLQIWEPAIHPTPPTTPF